MNASRSLIVNADDFGLSSGTNRGIVESHQHGIVTSASLMVRGGAAAMAADYARTRRELSVGLHADFGEWEFRSGAWRQNSIVLPLDDADAVAEELGRQLDEFRRLVDRDPSHLDSHQHVHRQEPARAAFIAVSRQLGIPLRSCAPEIAYVGDFYGQERDGLPFPEGVSIENLVKLLRGLPAGVTELGVHPGLDETLPSIYCQERLLEVRALCDPRIRQVIATEDIQLASFEDVARRRIA